MSIIHWNLRFRDTNTLIRWKWKGKIRKKEIIKDSVSKELVPKCASLSFSHDLGPSSMILDSWI